MKNTTKQNLRVLGFSDEINKVENNQCAFCGSKKILKTDFRDELSWKEFNISNLCQMCQDDIFGI
jgi:hypothetical protein